MVSFEVSVILHVLDDWCYAVSSPHLAPDCRRGFSAGVTERDVETVAFDAVAAITAVGVGAPNLAPGEAGDLVDLRSNRTLC